jgi:glycosyltransferase involved in cell wall biosynthesis
MNSVAMVCPYADRPEFIPQILASFRKQTHENKWLVIYDNGRVPFEAELQEREVLVRNENGSKNIGELRNLMNACTQGCDIVAHLDSDDWSHPERLSEQVALLRASGADVVGYNECVFERSGEAWVYKHADPTYALGTSLCYWRKTWERNPFPRISTMEDRQFTRGLKCQTVSGLTPEPRTIARIHAGNARNASYKLTAREWRRAPELDEKIYAKVHALLAVR